MKFYCFPVNYLIIKTRLAWNAGSPASLQRLLPSMATGGARLYQDSDSAPGSSATQGPSKEGTSGQGGPDHSQGRPRGCSTAVAALGVSALSDMAVSKPRQIQAQRKDHRYHKFSFSFLKLEWMVAATITFYSICAAWALISTNKSCGIMNLVPLLQKPEVTAMKPIPLG